MLHGCPLNMSPLAPDHNVDPVVHNLFLGGVVAVLNIALRGKGGTVHDDIDVGAWLHIHHKSVANFLPAPVKNAHPR